MYQRIELPLLPFPIFSYGLLILLGFMTATFLCQREAARRGLARERVMDFGVWGVLAGVVGARVFYVVQFWEESFAGRSWFRLLAIWEGGLVFYGGFLTALLVGGWYLWRHDLPVVRVLDTCAPFVPVGMAFGRIGCWLNGCCWGWRCSAAMPAFLTRFPPGSPAHGAQVDAGLIDAGAARALPLHPTQLYDAGHSLLMFVLLWWYLRKNPPDGAPTLVLLVLYGVGRFCLEWVRGDHIVTFTGLTVAQNISLAMVAAGFAGLTCLGLRRRCATDAANGLQSS